MALQLLMWTLVVGASAVCLPNGTSAVDRKDLVNVATGESYAIGLWRNGDYPAARLTAAVVQILIQEMLGMNVELKGPGALTLDGFYALMGCATPLDANSRGCVDSNATYVHINVEVWTAGYASQWKQIQSAYPKTAPKNLGNMGYNGATAMYIPISVQQKAYDAESINLDFFRDYNASRQRPGAYFASPGDLNVSRLLPCADSALMQNEIWQDYARITQDWDGVLVDAQGLTVGKCWEGFFWYAPACRVDPAACLTWLSGGTGWGLNEIIPKAAVYNIPLATAVASDWDNYVALPAENDLMLYWWVPDPTFLRLDPKRIVFPDHDPDGYAKGDRSSAAKDISVDKHVSHDLSALAPEVEELLSRFQVSITSVNELLLDHMDSKDSDLDVACRWLRANEEKWTTWLPEKGKCYSQFGMYHEKQETFLQTRSEVAITCKACPSGTYSAELEDSKGITFICQECPSGSFQALGASVSCSKCPAGSFQNQTGSLGCNRCAVGHYQYEEGQRGCKVCPAGATTLLLGSDSMSDCGCKPGSINIGGEALECTPCGEGLDCPFGSSIQTLQSGQPSSEQLVTQIQRGYFATQAAPLQLLRCEPEHWCPGGVPGTCLGGLEGEPCAFCPDGQVWSGEDCDDCGATTFGWLVAVLFVLMGAAGAYFFTNTAVTAQASPFKSVQIAAGLGINAMQILALLGLMSAKWPQTFENTSSALQIFVLDLDRFGLSCLLGSSAAISYFSTTLVCPFLLLWLALCHALTHLSCMRRLGLRPWKLPYTVNTAGLILQLGFGTIAAVSLKPMMCYRHPNQRHSVLTYPSIFCGESHHGLMLVFGITLLMLFTVGFLVVCGYGAWRLPGWSARGEHWKVQCFRFCTSNFRLECYGFIIPLLLRGLGFAISITVGTNFPPVQTALVSIVLVVYTVLQASIQPWKVPAVNLTDSILSGSLLILAGRSIQVDMEMETEFAEYFTAAILTLVVSCVSLLLLLCSLAFVLQRVGGNWNGLLSLQWRSQDPEEISRSLKKCAQTLLELESAHLRSTIEATNSYDLQTVLNLINVVQAEFKDRSGRGSVVDLGGRVQLAALNARLTVTDVDAFGMAGPSPEGPSPDGDGDPGDGDDDPSPDGDGDPSPDADDDQKPQGDDDQKPDGDGTVQDLNDVDLESKHEAAEKSNVSGGKVNMVSIPL